MATSFKRSVLKVRFTLAQGGFAGGGNASKLNTLELGGLRMSAKAVNAGGAAMGELQLGIMGMRPSDMKALSTLGMRIQQVPIFNTVTLLAGKEGGALTMVFQGGIQSAYADLEAQPEVTFRVLAKSGLPEAVTGVPATSYPGGVDVSTVLSGLAKQATPPLAFENNGVSKVIPNQYYYGSVRTQIQQCCEAAGIGWSIDKGTLLIWPRNGSREGDPILISPATGMIDYPAYTAMGIRIRTLFDPTIRFMGKVRVLSDQVKDSVWTVYKLSFDLDAELPGGKWESVMECYNPDFPTPVPR